MMMVMQSGWCAVRLRAGRGCAGMVACGGAGLSVRLPPKGRQGDRDEEEKGGDGENDDEGKRQQKSKSQGDKEDEDDEGEAKDQQQQQPVRRTSPPFFSCNSTCLLVTAIHRLAHLWLL